MSPGLRYEREGTGEVWPTTNMGVENKYLVVHYALLEALHVLLEALFL